MRTSFILYLGIRNLLQRGLRSLLTVLGISIGVSTIIFLVGLGAGLRQLVVGQISTPGISQTVIVNANGTQLSQVSAADYATLAAEPTVATAAAENQVAGQASAGTSTADTVIHLATEGLAGLSSLSYVAGKSYADSDMVINQALARSLQITDDTAALGTRVTLTLPGHAEPLTRTVSGIVSDYATPQAYLVSDSALDGYTSLTLRARSSAATDIQALRAEVSRLGYHSDYIGDTVAQVNSLFTIFTVILGGFGLIALVVALLGNANTLAVNLLEKTREVGFMKALGVQKRDIRRIFITESLLLSIAGSLLGVAVAFLMAGATTLLLYRLAGPTYPAGVAFFAFSWPLVVLTMAGMLLLGWITGMPPARRAARINPLEALRYE